MKEIELLVNTDYGVRLDYYLSQKLDEFSRTYIQGLIKDGLVLVNDRLMKAKYTVKEGDLIHVKIPPPQIIEISPEDLPIRIVYEDDDIVIINKTQDLVVHPAPGNYKGTLVNALLYHINNLSSINGIVRPGIVHRLDKDTSGLLIVAKNNHAHRFLSEELKNRNIKREYIAIVKGLISENRGIINAPIGRDSKDRKKMTVTYKNSREAITRYKVLEKYDKYTLVRVSLQTGRTHQIRVHFAYINHPILGDQVYSRDKNLFNLKGQLLHAVKLGFMHPRSGEYLEFETDMPERFKSIINKLK